MEKDKDICNYCTEGICAILGCKCDNPKDDNCAHYEPWNPDDHLEGE